MSGWIPENIPLRYVTTCGERLPVWKLTERFVPPVVAFAAKAHGTGSREASTWVSSDSTCSIHSQTDPACHAGKCVLTLGTSTDDAGSGSGGLDLIPSHSYAVIGKLQPLLVRIVCIHPALNRVPATDVRETGERRQLVLVNPWRSTPPDSAWTSGLREALRSAEGESVNWQSQGRASRQEF